MNFHLTLVALLATLFSGGQASKNPNVVVDDVRRDIRISYSETDTLAIFTSRIRGGPQVTVLVDGNQDGQWGAGAFDPNAPKIWLKDDFSYQHDAEPCPRYLEYGLPKEAAPELRRANPDGVYILSTCGKYPSQFTMETRAADRSDLLLLVYKIPKTELFGNKTTAHVLFEVLDDTGRHAFYTLAKPLILQR